MSILIKGMNMPRDIAPNVHQKIILVIGSNGLVYEANRNRLPAVAVNVPEPHGRLIDADKYFNKVLYEANGIDDKELADNFIELSHWLLEKEPTVIEAEGEEK